jgi:hypothetical protein
MEEKIHTSGRPVSTLPGTTWNVEEGTMCDDHLDRKAERRVQGETDSFGAEYHYMCRQCLDEFLAFRKEEYETEHRCDWCGNMKKHVAKYRDANEGQGGPVYDVCEDCRNKDRQHWAEEAARYRDEHGDSSFDDDDGWD